MTNNINNSTTDNMTMDKTARTVRFNLVKGKRADFTKLFNSEVLPTLKKQDGFKNEVLLVQDDHVVGISMWNSPEALKNYETSTYPAIERMLTPVLQGKPTIETYALAAI
jgi:heme-degrading monooxygenase HmoA